MRMQRIAFHLGFIGALFIGQMYSTRVSRRTRGQFGPVTSRQDYEEQRARQGADTSQEYAVRRQAHQDELFARRALGPRRESQRVQARVPSRGASSGGFRAQRDQEQVSRMHREHQADSHSNARIQRSRQTHQFRQQDTAWPNFYKLINTMKLYKSENVHKFAGHIYEHSMWTAMAIHDWFQHNDSWVEDIYDTQMELLVLAGLFHNVGKIAQSDESYGIGFDDYFDTVAPHIDTYPYFADNTETSQTSFELLRPGRVSSIPGVLISRRYVPGEITEQSVRDELQNINSLDVNQFDTLVQVIRNFLTNYRSGDNVVTQDVINVFNFEGTSLTTEQKADLVRALRRLISSRLRPSTLRDNFRKGEPLSIRIILNEELGLSDVDRKFVALLAGMVFQVETLIKSYGNDADQNRSLFQNFLNQLSLMAHEVSYNDGGVDASLVRSVLLLGVASIRTRDLGGRTFNDEFEQMHQSFLQSYRWFQSRPEVFEIPREHGAFSESTSEVDLEGKGEAARDGLIAYLNEIGGVYQAPKPELQVRQGQFTGQRPYTGYNSRVVRTEARQAVEQSTREPREGSVIDQRRRQDSRVLAAQARREKYLPK